MVDKKTVDQRSVLLRGLILVLLLMLECRELENWWSTCSGFSLSSVWLQG